MRDPERDQPLALGDRPLDRGRDRSGIVGVGAHRDIARRLVHRRVRRRHDRRPARHRLDDRHPEALEARRVDGDGGAAVEAGQLLVGDEAEPTHPRVVELRLLAPALAAGDREQDVAAEEPVRLDERLEVLARLERGDAEDVGRAEIGRGPVAVNTSLTPGGATRIRAGSTPSSSVVSAAVNVRVDEDDVAGLGGVGVLAAVHRLRALRRPLREAERHEVVDRRRAHPGPLRWVHPVGEVEHVERAEKPLGGGMAGACSRRCGSHARRAAARCAARRRCPASASRMRAGPRRLVGANATSSCSPAGRLEHARRACRGCSCRRPSRGCESGLTSKAILTAGGSRRR